MTKYEVLKETGIEMRNPNPLNDYNVKELEEYSEKRSDTYHELVKQFDTMDEAREFFENEKKYCDTRKEKGFSNITFFLFDELILAESEYDEDGEFVQSEWWDSYIADDDCLHPTQES